MVRRVHHRVAWRVSWRGVQVATDADIRAQIASGHRSFDLVDHDLLEKDKSAFRVHKYMKLGEFKELVSG